MSATKLKRSLKACTGLPEDLNIRLHRAISWLKCAETNSADADLGFLTHWIALNACYALDMQTKDTRTERDKFRQFIENLVKHDQERRIFNLLWERFSGPVKMLIENQFVFKRFWDYQRGEVTSWEGAFRKSNEIAVTCLAEQNVAGLLEILLDRLYVLRNQLMHGGATYGSGINRRQVRDGANMLQLLVPILIDIMMQHPEENWGTLLFPVVKENS